MSRNDLVKIEYRSGKRSPISSTESESEESERFSPFLPIPFTPTPSLRIQWLIGYRSRKQKRKNQPIARPGIEHCNWLILLLLLATLTMQFSLERKRRSHKRNLCFASDSVSFIFTRSYHSALLISTPTRTSLLVKASLKRAKNLCFAEKDFTKTNHLLSHHLQSIGQSLHTRHI